MMHGLMCRVRQLLALLLLMLGMAAQAATLQISPVMVELQADQTASGLSLSNSGERAIYGQVRVFLWDQVNGDDTLAPTQELIASPPLMKIPPHGEQLVRLVRKSSTPVSAEQSYRIVIDEIPVAEDLSASESSVKIRLRYSVPVFVSAGGPPAQPKLAWQVQRRDDAWILRLANSGAKRAQVGALTLTNAAGKDFVITQGLFGYALAGREREWRLSVKPDTDLSGPLAIKANINANPVATSTAGSN